MNAVVTLLLLAACIANSEQTTCDAGYTCTSCGDVDECQTNNGGCDVHATCTNSVGSFSCACNTGFSGNGFSCTDVDECQTNNGGCDADATCTNSAGSFSCACNSGFNGNGFSCTENVYHIGCYADSADRDLNGAIWNDSGMNVQTCLNDCRSRGLRYAGLQASNWCLCGNTYGKHGTATNCNMACVGNANDNCGGAWANSIWTSGV